MPTEKVLIIDRIVEGTAICECVSTGKQIEISAKNLPRNAKEGDVIREDARGTYIIDSALTEQRLAEMTSRMDKLFKRKL